jgi:formylglycine-generating enzyme required for sulfatase activity
MGRLPSRSLSLDGGVSRPVRNVWLSARELTVGQFARIVDSIRPGFANRKQIARKLEKKVQLARYLERYRPRGRRWRTKNLRLPSWAYNQIDPARRDEPIRGVPQHVARDLAAHLGLRLPTQREWLWAATLRSGAGGPNRAGIAGLQSKPHEWLAESGVAGEAYNTINKNPSPTEVGIRFALDRE